MDVIEQIIISMFNNIRIEQQYIGNFINLNKIINIF